MVIRKNRTTILYPVHPKKLQKMWDFFDFVLQNQKIVVYLYQENKTTRHYEVQRIQNQMRKHRPFRNGKH